MSTMWGGIAGALGKAQELSRQQDIDAEKRRHDAETQGLQRQAMLMGLEQQRTGMQDRVDAKAQQSTRLAQRVQSLRRNPKLAQYGDDELAGIAGDDASYQKLLMDSFAPKKKAVAFDNASGRPIVYDPDDPQFPEGFTGPHQQPPVRNIDPNSAEGIRATAERAGAVAKAEQPYKRDPNAALVRNPTDGERQAAGLLPEIEAANAKLDAMTPSLLSETVNHTPIIGNFLKTDSGRQFDQMATQFLANTIYAKSGKAITDGEKKELRATYIPQAGDDETTLNQKTEARRLFIQGAYIVAGRAAPKGGGSSGGGDPEAAWVAKNPGKKGESWDAYHARYLKSRGG